MQIRDNTKLFPLIFAVKLQLVLIFMQLMQIEDNTASAKRRVSPSQSFFFPSDFIQLIGDFRIFVSVPGCFTAGTDTLGSSVRVAADGRLPLRRFGLSAFCRVGRTLVSWRLSVPLSSVRGLR